MGQRPFVRCAVEDRLGLGLEGIPDVGSVVDDRPHGLAKEAVRAGEVFQVVPSQRYELDCPADALDVYRVLRISNPSPYMYLLRLPTPDGGRYDVVGSSPEALVKVNGRHVMMHPIAGSRPRGATPEEDTLYAEQLLADDKERAEHVMLVDLARNDVGRVCEPGSVEVLDFMHVERYSHIMHIVSTVVGRLREGCSAYDALVATFPAGTLSGAPKVRAMELIESSSRAGAASTAARSVTWTSPATWTWPSRSAPP